MNRNNVTRETYIKLTKSRSYLRNKLQSIFMLSTTFLGFLLIFTFIKMVTRIFVIVDLIPIVVYMPLYISMLVRKVKILSYRRNNNIKL